MTMSLLPVRLQILYVYVRAFRSLIVPRTWHHLTIVMTWFLMIILFILTVITTVIINLCNRLDEESILLLYQSGMLGITSQFGIIFRNFPSSKESRGEKTEIISGKTKEQLINLLT